MPIALVATLLDQEILTYWLIAAGLALGSAVGVASARVVK